MGMRPDESDADGTANRFALATRDTSRGEGFRRAWRGSSTTLGYLSTTRNLEQSHPILGLTMGGILHQPFSNDVTQATPL